MSIHRLARAHGRAEKTYGDKWADAAKGPGDAVGNLFAIAKQGEAIHAQ